MSEGLPARAKAFSTDPHNYFSVSTRFPTSFPRIGVAGRFLSLPVLWWPDSMPVYTAMAKKTSNSGQILLFPTGAAEGGTQVVANLGNLAIAHASVPTSGSELGECQVVLSGSYRKDFEALRATYEELLDRGCRVLSPTNVTAVRETNGFVFMKGEESESPEAIEGRHLDAIQKANFVWLHTPEGYIGPSASLEIGFARAIGVPVYAKGQVSDPVLRPFINVVPSLESAVEVVKTHRSPVPRPALGAFQEYYRRVAVQRGYSSESPKDCLLLMVEEVGELAREIRRRERLVRHGPPSKSSESRELADIFLYVVHMANVLDVDLARIVQEKELINLQRLFRG